MSASKHVTIWCDAEGCNGWHDAGEPTVYAARNAARTDGWLTGVIDKSRQPANNPRRDLCPGHRFEPQR